jgi:hypothetical protein
MTRSRATSSKALAFLPNCNCLTKLHSVRFQVLERQAWRWLFLGRCAVQSGRSLPTFQRYLLPALSGRSRLHGAIIQKTAVFKLHSVFDAWVLSLPGIFIELSKILQKIDFSFSSNCYPTTASAKGGGATVGVARAWRHFLLQFYYNFYSI